MKRKNLVFAVVAGAILGLAWGGNVLATGDRYQLYTKPTVAKCFRVAQRAALYSDTVKFVRVWHHDELVQLDFTAETRLGMAKRGRAYCGFKNDLSGRPKLDTLSIDGRSYSEDDVLLVDVLTSS